MEEYLAGSYYPSPIPEHRPEKKDDCVVCVEKVRFDLPTGCKDNQALWIKNEMIIRQDFKLGKREEFFIEEKIPWALLIIRKEEKKKPY